MKKIILLIMLIAAVGELSAQNRITLEDYLTYKFYPDTRYSMIPTNEDDKYITADGFFLSRMVKCSYKTGAVTDTLGTVPEKFTYCEFPDDYSKILYYKYNKSIHRHSFYASYFVYDFKEKMKRPLYDSDLLRIASITHDGTKVAFVYENNILLKTLETGKIDSVTTDGKPNYIINGAPDWVYEEEFGFDKAYEFSPDGRYIAYIKFDESKVKSYTLQYFYEADSDNPEYNYPINYVYKYPKVGEESSIVTVHIYDTQTKETVTADLGKNTDIYVPRILWNGSNNLIICRLNRTQSILNLLNYDITLKTTTKFFEMKDPKYIEEDVVKSINFINNGQQFIIQSEQDKFRHLYLYDLNGKLVNQITSGDKEIIAFKGYDPKEKRVYYTGVGDNSTQQAVYSIGLNGKNLKKLSKQNGINDAEFSANCKYYVNTFSNHNTPSIVSVCDNNGNTIRILEDNEALQNTLKEYEISEKELFTWRNRNGTELNGFIYKPLDFDSTKKYPVLVVGYNGPNHNEVNDEFYIDWYHVLTTKGYIVACTDTRGTGRKGTVFRKCTYGQLGNLETEDLVDFAKYLGNINYIDGTRLGIYGWSYGGFMVSNLMTRGAGTYKVGIAVAPVESWEYYDNIYTERYMGLISNNLAGYKDNSPIKYADKLEGKLLLIYGSADDNVHPQNSMLFNEALVQADKDFDMMQYTNRDHSIYGKNTRKHLFTKIINYIEKNL